jgi:hypothetical protein
MSDDDTTRRPAIRVLSFWTDYVPDKENPGQMKGVDWAEWGKIGDKSGATTRERINLLKPRVDRQGQQIEAIEWQVVGPAYERWKASEEIPENGTPLAAWPGADRALVDVLKKFNILTVEDFAGCTDQVIAQAPIPDLRRRRKMAEDFLLAQGDQARVEAELASRDQKIASQDSDIADLREQIASLAAQLPKPEKTRLKAVQ